MIDTTRPGGTSEVVVSGATYVSLPPFNATKVRLFNDTGVSVNWKIDSGSEIPLGTGKDVLVEGITNTLFVSVNRSTGAGPIKIKFNYF